jgi:porin
LHCWIALFGASWLFVAMSAAAQPPESDPDKRDWHAQLQQQGVSLGGAYIGEVRSVVDGGFHRDTIYAGRLETTLDVDLQTALGWDGALFHATAYQLHGRGLGSCCLANTLSVSNIEARRSTRLFTLWLQQSFADSQVSLRLGQLAADDEFFTSHVASPFLNGTFGWPAVMVANTPSGGAAFPHAAPGARLHVAADVNRSLLLGVFAGDPAGKHGPEDPEIRNPSGTTFSLSGGALVMAEAQYNITADTNPDEPPASYKLGLWVQTGDRPLDMFGDIGKRGPSWGGYAIAERMLWRPADAEGDTGLSMFLRIGAGASQPQPIRFYVDAGLSYRGPFGRTNDLVGLAVAYSPISNALRQADIGAEATQVRSYEAVIELTYQLALAHWFVVQPDLQYVVRPGAGAPDPVDPSRRIPNATVLGLRTTLRF